MLSVNLLLNSVVSTPGAKFFTADISIFNLMTPLKHKEYVRLKLSEIPEDVLGHYNFKINATKDVIVYWIVMKNKSSEFIRLD